MRHDRQKAVDLRKQGKSYKEIQSELRVSKGTLSSWFKGEAWAQDISLFNKDKERTKANERMKKLNMIRRAKFAFTYAVVEEEAEKEFELYKNDTLFWAGLMLYIGSGDVSSRNMISLRHQEPFVHKTMIDFASRYLDLDKSTIKCRVSVPSALSGVQMVGIWSSVLGVPVSILQKNQGVQDKDSQKKLQNSSGISILSTRVVVKKKLLRWTKLAEKHQFGR